MKKINNKGAVPVGLIILLVVAALAVVAVFAFKGFGFGGEQGIRTLETLLTFTRFPIVLLRPARTTLRICNQMLVYYI